VIILPYSKDGRLDAHFWQSKRTDVKTRPTLFNFLAEKGYIQLSPPGFMNAS
jgi:hypothetical protein